MKKFINYDFSEKFMGRVEDIISAALKDGSLKNYALEGRKAPEVANLLTVTRAELVHYLKKEYGGYSGFVTAMELEKRGPVTLIGKDTKGTPNNGACLYKSGPRSDGKFYKPRTDRNY